MPPPVVCILLGKLTKKGDSKVFLYYIFRTYISIFKNINTIVLMKHKNWPNSSNGNSHSSNDNSCSSK